jgi:hypothetical protein
MALTTARLWLGRVAASLILVLGGLVFTSAVETGSLLLFALSATGLGGALLFIFGIERPTHRLAGVARLVGWVSMFVFTLVPTSLLFLPLLVVLLALPAVFEARLSPRPGREASGSLAPGPR